MGWLSKSIQLSRGQVNRCVDDDDDDDDDESESESESESECVEEDKHTKP